MNNSIEENSIKKYMPTKDDLNSLSNFFSAFSDDTRLKILVLLTIKSMCVGSISNVLKINQTTISHQLKILKAAGLVDYIREGKKMIYYLKNNAVETIFEVAVDFI